MKVIKYFPYRKGRISSNVIIFPRESMKSFEETLAKLANVKLDNHVCYLVDHSRENIQDNLIKAYMFSDDSMYMGNTIEEKSW